MSATQYFYELTPDRIFDAFTQAGIRARPAIRFLNSLENRVALLEDEDGQRWVSKFYRPGRWSKDAILEEHAFLDELRAGGVPVVPPRKLPGTNSTIGETAGIMFSVFPQQKGRMPDEILEEHARAIGPILAQLHKIGAQRPTRHRPQISAASWGTADLDALRRLNVVPSDIWPRYESAVQRLVSEAGRRFEGAAAIRIHGDCHRANVLWGSEGPWLVDFDDMATGPPVHDVWMLIPGHDPDAAELRDKLIEAYEIEREFAWETLALIEPLRALKYVHHAAWLAARRDDPAFVRLYGEAISREYWRKELSGLEDQLERIEYGR